MQNNTSTKTAGRKDLVTTVVAGVAGLALLAGGTTFALWSDSATIDGVDIATGSLSVDADELAWFDTTGTGAPDAIDDIDDFTAMPGTSIRGVSELAVALSGTGIEAELSLTGGALTGNDNIVDEATVYLFQGALPGGPPNFGNAVGDASLTDGSASITIDELGESSPATWTVVVVLEFDAEGGSGSGTPVQLDDIEIELVQVTS